MATLQKRIIHRWQLEVNASREVLELLRVVLGEWNASVAPGAVTSTVFLPGLHRMKSTGRVVRRIMPKLDLTSRLANLYGKSGHIRLWNVRCATASHQHDTFAGLTKLAFIRDRPDKLSRFFRTVPGTKILTLATSNTSVIRVLEFMGSGAIDWPTIYRILEAIVADLEGQTGSRSPDWQLIATKGWATHDTLKRLKQTANHYRHAKSHHALPSRPFNLARAGSIVRKIVRLWVASLAA